MPMAHRKVGKPARHIRLHRDHEEWSGTQARASHLQLVQANVAQAQVYERSKMVIGFHGIIAFAVASIVFLP